MHRKHLLASFVVVIGSTVALFAPRARAQIDCAQCTAVCRAPTAPVSTYPDDLRPEALSAQVKHGNADAREQFEDARSRDPSFGGHEIAAAVAGYKKAVLLDGNNAQYRNYLAAALLTAGEPAEAIYNLQAAIRLVPAEAKYLVNLGYAFHRQGDETRALVSYMRGLIRDPSDTRARLFTAYALELLGLTDDAALELKKVLAQEPKNDGALRALARINQHH